MSKTPTTDPLDSQRLDTVDAYVELDGEKQRFAAKSRKHAELRAVIQSWYPDRPTETFTALGRFGDVIVSPRSTERTIGNLKALYKLSGVDRIRVMLKCVTLKVIDELFSDEEKSKFLESGPTGARGLKTVSHNRDTRQ